MIHRASPWLLTACLLMSTLVACRPSSGLEDRLEILPHPLLSATQPRLLAENLDNPSSPRVFDGNVSLPRAAKGRLAASRPKAASPSR